MADSAIRASFEDQAGLCARLGSEFTALVLRGLAQWLDRSTGFGTRILDWSGDPAPQADALALRAAGGLHALVREGKAPALGALYPPNDAPPSADALADALQGAIAAHDAWLTPWLDSPPQTNEIGRSAVLYPGLATIAARTGLPLSIYELGASAGLNLILDRYAYRLGDVETGQAGATLTLAPKWEGPAPTTKPQIVARRGCDLAPVDLMDPVQAGRLPAYVWADQAARLARLSAGITLFRAAPVALERADASHWIPDVIQGSGVTGQARVLMHSIAFTYLPPKARAAVTAHMETVGARATEAAPLAWLAFELGKNATPSLTLRLWPGGETETLATADPHVREVTWL